MTNDKMPPCPFCSGVVKITQVDGEDFWHTLQCGDCHATQVFTSKENAEDFIRAKLSGHRIGDDLYRRVVEVIDTMAGLVEHDAGCLWLRRGLDCNCPTGKLEAEAGRILSELGEAKGDAEVVG